MATPAQLPQSIILLRGTTFDFPLAISDSNGLIDWTGKEVRFMIFDESDPNASCCNDAMLVDISSKDTNSQISLAQFLISDAGVSPAVYGNVRITIPPYAPADDAGNKAGISLTSQLACQDTKFWIAVVTPASDATESDVIDPYVIGRISIVS
jgi:hypothetical protein